MLKKFLSLLLLVLLCLPFSSCTALFGEEDDEVAYFERDEHGFAYAYNGDGTYTLVEIPANTPSDVTIDFFKGQPVTRIAEDTFRNNTSITSITLGDSVTTIGSCAFYGCTSLLEVRGGRRLTTIGRYAFAGCSSLTSAPLPQGILSLGEFCFSSCAQLTVSSLPDSLTHIGQHIFDNSTGVTFTTYDNAYYLACGDNPYYYLYSAINQEITSVSVHPEARVIMGSAFKTCTELYLVNLESKLERICAEAFWRCSSLESITLPQSIIALGENTFRLCSSLTNVILGDRLIAIGREAFRECSSLVTYHYGNAVYLSSHSNPYYALLRAESKTTASVNVHPSTKIIAAEAFDEWEELKSISLPDGLLAIDDGAFSCTGLQSITIPDSVVRIGRSAFWGCDQITTAKIGQGVTVIEESAFQNCASMKTIIIPDSVKTIAVEAFYACDKLSSVTIGASVTTIGQGAFADCTKLTTVVNRSNLNIVAGASTFGGVALHAKKVSKS